MMNRPLKPHRDAIHLAASLPAHAGKGEGVTPLRIKTWALMACWIPASRPGACG
jgi:hypothetical protein